MMKAAIRISEERFSRLVVVTIFVVYLVILAGGIVRSTGSGMGCPDWPKCFGSWVPPTSEAQLPADYRESFAIGRMEKNQRLAGYLEAMGFKALAAKLQSEQVAAPEAAFNKYKTWTEYINRLLGVILGLLIIAMTATSFTFRKNHPALFYGSLAALLLVVFQGWIGSVVVSSNLLPGMITFHMVLAALLIFVLVYVFHLAQAQKPLPTMVSKYIRWFLLVSTGLFLVQIVLGTQVREAVDITAIQLGHSGRGQWIGNLGNSYYFHRSFSLLLLAMTGYLVLHLRGLNEAGIKRMADMLFLLVVTEVLLGIVMAYFGFPSWAQPLHLLGALMILGIQFWLYLRTKSLNRA